MAQRSLWKEFTKGIIQENPTLCIVLGLCPTLAISTSLKNAFGMGIAATFVLVCSNIIISIIKNIVPNKIRIPIYIVVIATFVSIVEMVMGAYTPALYKALGIFVPLIVVNCIILGRAEAFANKNSVLRSLLDGIGMGVGFTIVLAFIGLIREIIGDGKIWGFPILGAHYEPMLIIIMPPGGFFILGSMLAYMKWKNIRKETQKLKLKQAEIHAHS
jgi:electron transport complex protein RnfE